MDGDDGNAAVDDAYAANGDDAAAVNDDAIQQQQVAYDDQMDAAWEDDLFHWNSNVGFDGVSIMPVSCIN